MAKLLTEEQDSFLRQNALGRSNLELAQILNANFGLGLSVQQIKTYKHNHKFNSGLTGRFEKGGVPYNKGKKLDKGPNRTSFKKGNTPHNYKPVGSERLSKDGYQEIKIKDPRTWAQKHVLIWEKAHGKKPKGYIVVFADNDKTNLSLDNLVLVPRRLHGILNQNKKKFVFNNADQLKTCMALAEVVSKTSRLKKQTKKGLIK